jgi:hypothetical protein
MSVLPRARVNFGALIVAGKDRASAAAAATPPPATSAKILNIVQEQACTFEVVTKAAICGVIGCIIVATAAVGGIGAVIGISCVVNAVWVIGCCVALAQHNNKYRAL